MIGDQPTEEMVATDSETEEEEDRDPEVAMTPGTDTTEEEDTIPETEVHQVVATTEEEDQEVATGIEEDLTTRTAMRAEIPGLITTAGEVAPQDPEEKVVDHTGTTTPNLEAVPIASTVTAEVVTSDLSWTTNTVAEEQDPTALVREPTEDKAVTAEVHQTESTMTMILTAEITMVSSEAKSKSTPTPEKTESRTANLTASTTIKTLN